MMGWGLAYDENWDRFVGYRVPAYCDHPDCNEKIDRGLEFACGDAGFGLPNGCGLFFCERHREYDSDLRVNLCERCRGEASPFEPSSEHPDWANHVLSHESWSEWREKNPDKVKSLREAINAAAEIARPNPVD